MKVALSNWYKNAKLLSETIWERLKTAKAMRLWILICGILRCLIKDCQSILLLIKRKQENATCKNYRHTLRVLQKYLYRLALSENKGKKKVSSTSLKQSKCSVSYKKLMQSIASLFNILIFWKSVRNQLLEVSSEMIFSNSFLISRHYVSSQLSRIHSSRSLELTFRPFTKVRKKRTWFTKI